MENQTLYFTHGPNMAYIVRPDGTSTLYADYIGLEKQEISHYSTNILGTMKGLQPCTLEQFTEIKWRVIRKMQEGGAI
jgi:hypothetical protein